jgi:gas vesicle protein
MAESAEDLKRDIERTRDDLGGTLDAIGDRVSPGRIVERKKNRLTHGVRSLKDRVMGTAGDASHAVSDRVHAMGDTAGTAAGQVKDMPETVRHQTQGAPLIAGGLAFGVGFLVAAAFPATRTERQAGSTVLDQVEPLKAELTSSGKELAEHLKTPAMQAASEVKEAAKDAAQSVTGTAKTAALDTADQAKSAAQTVKHDAAQQGSDG